MITYINSENKQDYTVLFNKASAKLGLIPIIKETLNPQTLETEITYQRREFKDEKWQTIDCEVKRDGDGDPVRDPETGKLIQLEVDENGNLLKLQRNPDGSIYFDNNGDVVVEETIYGISSLNEYFQHIVELAGLAIGEGRTGSDPYFLRVPLDEPFFEINANTRGITVPGELSQVGIVGDKLAEVVFFRIDRYFDAVDLNTREIYIEWELPDGTKGISRDYLRDVQSEKDKIIFGWAIGEELTQQVGTIRFAVRFVEWFDNSVYDEEHNVRTDSGIDTARTGAQLLYSFSSLPATITVSDSLHYSLFEDDEALEIYSSQTSENVGTIALYLEPSAPDSADQTSPQLADFPEYVRNLDTTYYNTATPITGKTNYYRINLLGDNLELRVEARSLDGGSVSYIFGRTEHTKDEGTGIKETGTTGLIAQTKFVPVTAGEIIPDEPPADFHLDRTYYKYLADGTYEVVSQEYIESSASTDVFYEKIAYVVIDKPGHYYSIATNRVGGKKPQNAYSNTFYVPWAAKPEVAAAGKIKNRFIPNEEAYSIAADPTIPESAIGDYRGKTNVRVTATATQDYAPAVTLAPTATVTPAADTNGLTYVWYKNANNHLQDLPSFHAEAYSRPDGKTNDEWAAEEEELLRTAGWEIIPDATGATYTTAEPGCYAVKIINDFNNDTRSTDLLDAGICRVTGKPENPPVDWTTFMTDARNGIIDPSIAITINKSEEEGGGKVDYDEVTYTWHRITLQSDVEEGVDWLADLEEATEDYISPCRGTVSFNAQGNFNIPFNPIKAGDYYLVIRNTLNDRTYVHNYGETIGVISINSN